MRRPAWEPIRCEAARCPALPSSAIVVLAFSPSDDHISRRLHLLAKLVPDGAAYLAL